MAVLSDFTMIEVGSSPALGFAGRLLADAGARVIKVEPPEGDPARRDGPRGAVDDPERSPLFLHLHTNKESVTLDLDSSAGLEVARRLVERADVLLESLSPAEATAAGLEWPVTRDLNERLVHASITPYGRTGPMKDYVATDITLFASSGAMYREGLPGREPLRYAGHMPRTFPGVVLAGLVMAALLRRRTTGRGDWIDLSEMDCWASHPNQITRRLLHAFSGDIEQREDTKLAATAAAAGFGRGTYRCLDGYLTFLPLGDRHWPRLVELVERPELADDPRFATREARRENRQAWEEIFEAYVGSRTVAEVFAAAQRAGIPAGPLNDAARLHSDPHLEAREFFQPFTHPVAGELRHPGPPARGGEAFWELRRPAPLLGADTRAVLEELLAASPEGQPAATPGAPQRGGAR